jgi:hypothetical protein
MLFLIFDRGNVGPDPAQRSISLWKTVEAADTGAALRAAVLGSSRSWPARKLTAIPALDFEIGTHDVTISTQVDLVPAPTTHG